MWGLHQIRRRGRGPERATACMARPPPPSPHGPHLEHLLIGMQGLSVHGEAGKRLGLPEERLDV